MATSKDEQPRKKGSMPSGVRGPGGPPSSSPKSSGAPRSTSPRPPFDTSTVAPTAFRRWLESRSYPLLTRLHSTPRWLVVILPAVFLFLGLVLTGPLAWLGGILLFVVWLFVAWLTALSWPALSFGSRIFRALVVLALLGVVVLKFTGRF